MIGEAGNANYLSTEKVGTNIADSSGGSYATAASQLKLTPLPTDASTNVARAARADLQSQKTALHTAATSINKQSLFAFDEASSTMNDEYSDDYISNDIIV